jgi:hypothetical protein
MKTYLLDIIPKIKRYSQKLDNHSLLSNQHWILFNNMDNSKNVWIFTDDNNLLISKDGIVEKGKWKLIDIDTIFIETSEDSLLLRNGFLDKNLLVLKLDGQIEYAFFINETLSKNTFSSLDDIFDYLKGDYSNEGNTKLQTKTPSAEDGPSQGGQCPRCKKIFENKYECPKCGYYLKPIRE